MCWVVYIFVIPINILMCVYYTSLLLIYLFRKYLCISNNYNCFSTLFSEVINEENNIFALYDEYNWFQLQVEFKDEIFLSGLKLLLFGLIVVDWISDKYFSISLSAL